MAQSVLPSCCSFARSGKKLELGTTSYFVFNRLDVGFISLIGFPGLPPFAPLVEIEVNLARGLFHLFVADAARAAQERKPVGSDDLVHVRFPKTHASFLPVLGPQF